MQVDKTTLQDLAVFHTEEEYGLFHKMDHAKTLEGKQVLKKIFAAPFSQLEEILEVQQILKTYETNLSAWPDRITNGTLLVIDKFLDDNPDTIPEHPNALQTLVYKWLHPTDYAMIRFSMRQVFEFIKGFEEIHAFFSGKQLPGKLKKTIEQTTRLLSDPRLDPLKEKKSFAQLSDTELLALGRLFHVDRVAALRKLMELFGWLDAWYAMAYSNQLLGLVNPGFSMQAEPMIQAKSLRHLLLNNPVGYDLEMNKKTNFIFLTGANMAGKSTLIKAVGIAVYMAHLGMGVPAEGMQLSLFEGILTNINVEDNIVKGESYFFNEVQRIRETITRINDGRRWLVLMDELFKGTNIQDAMKCSLAVIKGMIKLENGLFILSTHLYEIGEELQQIPSIRFKYFETILHENEMQFSYQLKDGISKDRMGYLLMQKAGVTALLDGLGK
jgi:DNA mismatch repair protein MutS